MSNQIVISSGAKVRSLEGVLTGSAGIVNSVPLGGANGVATLDSNGKVPLSQLPASVVTYLGTWNAATNTPTLANGTGDVGDLYICNVAGTVNFGAGPITFAVGDWVIYNGSQWQKSAGQNGTVTSVAVTESGDALNITGSPITTAGTINIGFAGNSTQYINGEGNLVTFPTLITEAQNLITDVYNETGATLTKGTVVYINGGHGNLPTVTKALATSDATSAQTYGVVQADISNNNNGHVVVIGSLGDLDTQAYAAGTQLYLSSTTAGAWTSVKQYAPAHLVYVGIVVRSHPTQGVVEIKIQNGFELDELHNVSAQTPSNNDGLFYNSSNSLWENKSIATALGYTPADNSLVVHLAGTETITGAKTFSSGVTISSTGTQPLKIANYATSLTSTSGYTTIGTNAAGFQLLNGGGSGAQFFYAASPQAYYLPSSNGTLALTSDIPSLSGYVPYTGATSQVDLGSNNLYGKSLNVWGDGTNGGGLNLKQYTSQSFLPGYGYTAVFTDSSYGFGIWFLNGASTGRQINFNASLLANNTGQTYYLPAATGTIALTSDIPSLANYVTLTGSQTITGIKTFTNEQLFGNGITLTGGYITYTSGAYNLTLNTNILTDNRNVYIKDGSGTLAFTSDLSSYLPLTGGTLTGALSVGTNLTVGNVLFGNSAQFSNAVTASAYFLNGMTAGSGALYWTSNRVTLANYNSGGSLAFEVNGGSTALTLASTGAATFSSSITASGDFINGTIANNGTGRFRGSFTSVNTSASLAKVQFGGGEGSQFRSYMEARQFWTGTYTDNELAFYVNKGGVGGTEAMTIKGAGNVGIGTSNIYSTARLQVNTGTNKNLAVQTGTTDTTGIKLNAFNDAADANIPIEINGSITILKTGETERMRITSSGNVLIGTTTDLGSFLTIGGNSSTMRILPATDNVGYVGESTHRWAAIYAANGTIQTSDRNEKTNIINSDLGLEFVMKLNPVSYSWKKDDGKKHYGLIAQEIEELGVEFGGLDKEDGRYGLNYSEFIAPLIKAIQESNQIIKDLQARIVTLESKIN